MRDINFKLHAKFWGGPLDGWSCCPSEEEVRNNGKRFAHCTPVMLGGVAVNVVGLVGPVARYKWDGNEPEVGQPFRYDFDGYENDV
jgi:hypothetical protein